MGGEGLRLTAGGGGAQREGERRDSSKTVKMREAAGVREGRPSSAERVEEDSEDILTMQAVFLKYIPWETENSLEVTRGCKGGMGVTV